MYGGEPMGLAKTEMKMSLVDRMENERNRLKARLAEVESVISALEKNPEVADIINLISRVA